MAQTIQVILPLPLDQPYTYTAPPEAAVAIGTLAVVPFGQRVLTGVVTEIGGAADPSARTIVQTLNPNPAVSAELLTLTRWMADYYACTWGEVIKAALPSGIEVQSQTLIARTHQPDLDLLRSEPEQHILQILQEHGASTRKHLQNVCADPTDITDQALRRLERDGLIQHRIEIKPPKVKARMEKHVRFAAAFQNPLTLKDLKQYVRGPKQITLLETLATWRAEGRPDPPQNVVLKEAGATAATLHRLVEKGILEIHEQEHIRTPFADTPAPQKARIQTLHKEQAHALKKIEAAIEEERFETFLLHGVTGSGKTEVYIRALKTVMAKDKTGIVLVPEIALTPQTVQRFRSHFGDQVAVLHSRMSTGERYDAWRHLQNGRYRIAIGPRSAVLAPLERLGLLVVDEEHESSYKQFDPAPRYHARDVAVMRALQSDAVCILGSATPSLESYVNATAGKYHLLTMPNRVPVPGHPAAPLPDIEVIDLTLEKKKHQLEGSLSKRLCAAIEKRLAQQEQVILLQNRRGYAPVVECEDCGWTPMCRACDVTLTLHKPKRQLRCHYCGYAQRIPAACAKCASRNLTHYGIGTQRVEEELEARFPGARILRMDLDTTGKKDAHHRILSQFGAGEADILIGTQMIAKGLDFSRVTLVGVINADTGMLLPDFRAGERTFQLLLQVAGRAGRHALRGEVILQTRNPKHSAIRHALTHDYVGFVEEELRERQPFGYPPFGHMVRIDFRGPNQAGVEKMARAWTAQFQKDLAPQASLAGIQVLGPEAAFIGRVKRQYRFHTLLKVPRTADRPLLKILLRQTTTATKIPKNGFRIALDVDPAGTF